MIELLPCPFCGEKLVQHDDHHGTWWAHKNEVGSCWASVEQIHDNDDAKRWNKRHAQCELDREALKRAFEGGFWAWFGPSNNRELDKGLCELERCWAEYEAEFLTAVTSTER